MPLDSSLFIALIEYFISINDLKFVFHLLLIGTIMQVSGINCLTIAVLDRACYDGVLGAHHARFDTRSRGSLMVMVINAASSGPSLAGVDLAAEGRRGWQVVRAAAPTARETPTIVYTALLSGLLQGHYSRAMPLVIRRCLQSIGLECGSVGLLLDGIILSDLAGGLFDDREILGHSTTMTTIGATVCPHGPIAGCTHHLVVLLLGGSLDDGMLQVRTTRSTRTLELLDALPMIRCRCHSACRLRCLRHVDVIV